MASWFRERPSSAGARVGPSSTSAACTGRRPRHSGRWLPGAVGLPRLSSPRNSQSREGVLAHQAFGCQLFGRLMDLRILMDQPTESISPDDPPSRRDDSGFARPEWRDLSQGTMRTVNVVVIGVLSQHGL
jgi:hypothetical protein